MREEPIDNLLKKIVRFSLKFPLGIAFLLGGLILGGLAGWRIFLRFAYVEGQTSGATATMLLVMNIIVAITVALPFIVFYYKMTNALDMRYNIWRWLDK